MAYLQLNRLTILKSGQLVYDEKFHRGVNIIRGENGVGKSTIANAIYYVLGGDFTKWLPEIAKCDFVVGELDLNDKVITVRREISSSPMQPMQIFYGDYDQASKNANGWVVHPYKRTNKGFSFSQVFFEALEYPEIETADDEYITFNQALRLMYIDQTSPLDELMKDIDFDSPLIRKTTADLLLGIYDNALFNLQLLVKGLRKDELRFESELKLLKNVYRTIDLRKLEESIQESETQLQRIDASLKDRQTITIRLSDRKANKLTALQKEIGELSDSMKEKLNEQSVLQFDKLDSQQFLDELANQVNSLTESEKIRSILGELHISYCPSCLQPTTKSQTEEHCELCKEPMNASLAQAQILRLKQQLQAQIRESNTLLQETEGKLETLRAEITQLKSEIRSKQNRLNRLADEGNSDKEQLVEEMLIKKGQLTQQITTLQSELITARTYWSIHRNYQRIKNEIENANKLIDEKKENQKQKNQLAFEQINKYARHLLINDGSYEADFTQARAVSLDFSRNTYALDGRNHFSASSQVILKNSIRFGIFFASVIVDFMRYPRFILCDNIEDKGMNEARSRNFQKNLVNLASSDELKEKRFQIIFTTSMMEKTLDVPTFTIGEYYTPNNKALKLSNT